MSESAHDDPLLPGTGERRGIKSYVLRQGRLSAAQQRALDDLLPRFGIAYQAMIVDLNPIFRRDAPKVLEIGFGMGHTTAEIAEANPHNDYIGIEVHTPGVGGLLKLIGERGLTNVRVIQHDAVEVLRHMLAEQSLSAVHVFFPDPWPKKRHHKRRIIQPDFVALLAGKLKPGGVLHVATDWEEYAQWILDVLRAEPMLENTTTDFAERPSTRPLTKFEARGVRLGHAVWDIIFRRITL